MHEIDILFSIEHIHIYPSSPTRRSPARVHVIPSTSSLLLTTISKSFQHRVLSLLILGLNAHPHVTHPLSHDSSYHSIKLSRILTPPAYHRTAPRLPKTNPGQRISKLFTNRLGTPQSIHNLPPNLLTPQHRLYASTRPR